MSRFLRSVIIGISGGVFGAVLLSFSANASELTRRDDLLSVFGKAGAKGTFALYDFAQDRLITVHHKRAETPYIPASTFKIVNTIIALETGAVSDVDEIVTVDPASIRNPGWKEPMGLRGGFPASNVPVYQEVAKRVGLEAYAQWLKRLDYGNHSVGDEVTTFWLKGPLKISATAQARFLADVGRYALPVTDRSQSYLHEISLIEKNRTYELHAKAGWTTAPYPGIGWWVGWVVQNGNFYGFALNMDMNDINLAPKREEIGRALLKELGLL